jgi:hypothetical protein
MRRYNVEAWFDADPSFRRFKMYTIPQKIVMIFFVIHGVCLMFMLGQSQFLNGILYNFCSGWFLGKLAKYRPSFIIVNIALTIVLNWLYMRWYMLIAYVVGFVFKSSFITKIDTLKQ